MVSDSIIKLLDDCQKDEIKKIVAGAIIILDNKILLLERAGGEFQEGLIELPSGGVNDDENIIEGLIREVKEETGLDVISVTDYLGSFDYLSRSGLKTRQFNFKVITEPGEIKINLVEHSSFMLLDLAGHDLDVLNISEQVKNILKK
jgi:8-oxo-dGTP diphosphatase